MFMILPTREDSDTVPTDDAPSEESRTRVRKACNRCRIKKSKCNGRIPCVRCERDNAVCTLSLGPKSSKELSRSYISSLEEQQLSLLEALKELYRRRPDDSTINDTMRQLQARGFDIGTIKPRSPAPQNDAPNQQQSNIGTAAETISWDYNGLTIDDLDSFLAQPATPQAVSNILWNFGDADLSEMEQTSSQQSVLQDIQMDIGSDASQDLQLDALISGNYSIDDCLMDSFLSPE
ncbi:hypothetical protein B0J11DRAFT_235022 [Dendryphion nanum]|uniref:Zn(2)-C6 fungal-type domain-containing protein n=1 Tax=Dendryphion nanum TaxID=256645 RepID=A0A9P9CYW5_9PLEO|nr:hypothetical protein B0J11DRAFT_235022 [Dendryphion nanum]